MYLFRRTYVKNWGHNPDKHKVKVRLNGKPNPFIDPGKITYIVEMVAKGNILFSIHIS